ncbi:MAG: gfo/Idh/MocA family oxidoreductase [Bacteroidetes bacterium]|nr:gfo/Idh/MocA family oxidoreductase [Bacteroidota bacterium]
MKNIWLVGTGYMAIEYAKVLKALDVNFVTVGRGEKNAELYKKETGCDAINGGIEKFIESKPAIPDGVIIAAGVQELSSITIQLIGFGIKNILVEKPGVCEPTEIDRLASVVNEKDANVLLAYNRRFYSSIIIAEEIIKQDGGITSFNFEFTEWGHEIEKLNKPNIVLQNLFLVNSSHVVDTAFFLGGKPTELSSYIAGSLNWHSRGSRFAGSGITDKNALFSYQADWAAPGRWGIELLTRKHRLVLRPMEILQVQKLGSVAIEQVTIDDSLDKKYKPGLFLQTKAFINNDYARFCTVKLQQQLINEVYKKISGY